METEITKTNDYLKIANSSRIIECESKVGKEQEISEPRIEIANLASLSALIERHPYFRERGDFEEHRQMAEKFVIIKKLQRCSQLDHLSGNEISRRSGINAGTVRDWVRDKSEPKLVRSLKIHETARRKWERSLSLEAKRRCIDPSDVHRYLKPLNEPDKEFELTDYSKTLERLYSSIRNPPKVIFATLFPYQRTGPNWLREISKNIELNRKDIENQINARLEISQQANNKLQIGITNSALYFWRRNISSDNWLNILNQELFFFKNPATSIKLVEASRKNLDLDKSTSKPNRGFSKLITQMSDVSENKEKTKSRPTEIEHKLSYLKGEHLHFILDSLNVSLVNIQPLIMKIGKTRNDSGGIFNPLFPRGEKLGEFRARAYAIIASDGHIQRSQLIYAERDKERRQYVRNLFRNHLGEIHCHETSQNRLVFSSVVGRILTKWGVPIGDKHLHHEFRLPEFIRKGNMRTKVAYLQEVIPEDGCFFTEQSRAWFSINRAKVLDGGSLSKKYEFVSRISPELKEFVRRWGKEVSYGKGGDYQKHVLLGGKLWRLTELKDSPVVRQRARLLRDLIKDNPCKLLDDEVRLAKSIGIKMTKRVKEISLFDSGRVSVTWYAKTRRQKDTINWAVLAAPASGYKRREVENWLAMLVE
ncbi:MAG: hypothetical protein ACFFCF_08425 [Promethearchaeota archaeon]